MKKKIKKQTKGALIAQDLKSAKALRALREAAEAATETLYKKIDECKTQAELEAMQESRDKVELYYQRSQKKSLKRTGPRFEKAVKALGKQTDKVKQETAELKEIVETIRLLEDLARLAATLALAFA